MASGGRTFTEDARRAQIIDCTIRALATLGYRQASMAKVAQLARITPGLISYHFGSKDELIAAVVAYVVKLATDLMVPRITAQKTASEALRVYFETNLEFMRLHREPLLALVEIITHDRHGPYATQQETALTDIEKVLAWGQHTGEFRDFPLRPMAIAIRGAVDAVPGHLLNDPDLDLRGLAVELSTVFSLATRRAP
ncbi:TetR/AcrR family transcriptional regulator [Microbispora bryophytorum]|uniref:TetR family transcriptional regulator n=1 Tax=Microbispora bryophytorum TaxID=1460882 RepID=A0A8H9LD23_9ACTN|nr:TetR/AcrR family transcriptional regulator [Microbispora bryophytorum]MBD3137969.1 TetR family transcriptional regulator [Microbispora bryophytorum]GGO22499.1 TetR family transcriptional regulator [Microbispora bryophytorum]